MYDAIIIQHTALNVNSEKVEYITRNRNKQYLCLCKRYYFEE